MKKPLISIVIPAYNVEQYLKRCIESILNQTYDNLEIILIDDGSPDNCGIIMEQYAKKDKRIGVYHKKNGGLSDARNFGIHRVTGEYITFIDSDDWVSPYYISNLYKAIKKDDSDISASWFTEIYKENSKEVKGEEYLKNYKCLSRKTALEKMLYQDGIETSAWGKLYKMDIFQDLRYPVGKLYEDIPVTYEILKRSKKIAVIGNVDYFYFQRTDSIQNVKFNKRKLDSLKHVGEMQSDIIENFPELFPAAQCRYFSILCNIIFQINDKEYCSLKNKLWEEVRAYRKSILLNPKARKKARIAALLSYGGYGLLEKIYSLNK